MLSEDTKVVELGSQTVSRRKSLNQLTLVNKRMHELYERYVDLYTVYTMRGDSILLVNAASIAGAVPSDTVRYLRLIIDVDAAPNSSASALWESAEDSEASLTRFLEPFKNLKDLKIKVLLHTTFTFDDAPADTIKQALLDKLPVRLVNVRSLVRYHLAFMMVCDSVVRSLSSVKKLRTSTGEWQQDVRRFSVSHGVYGLLEEAIKLGPGYMAGVLGRRERIVIEPEIDRYGELAGFTANMLDVDGRSGWTSWSRKLSPERWEKIAIWDWWAKDAATPLQHTQWPGTQKNRKTLNFLNRRAGWFF